MTQDDPVILLADYQPPAWRVRAVALDFELDARDTRVTSTLRLEADPTQPPQPLRLDGEDLELLDIALDGRPLAPDQYTVDATGLSLVAAPPACELRTVVRIRPDRNTRLEGLYLSRGALFTQCEAEGFRRITWFIDRPDVSAIYDVRLVADRQRYPVLLSNGDCVAAGDLGDGRHFVRWHDPHPKPCYLFALVAGDLARVSAPFTTTEGRAVEVNVWAEAGDLARCRFALEAVLRAMAWDERRFGRAYDLSVFNVVAAQDFTMGAMENKGLNIFNARYILADEDTATDEDFLAIESVIGHEYFHNWSGNRVTLRDWFQLSLKEGLTVFRDQEFTADLHSRGLKRIEDVRLLRSRQFVEDAGPLSHPVRPASYREINNFYTATVYEKGAELVRMLHTLLGESDFRRGLDLYFTRHDGGAATVEDLLAALAEASGRDLAQFLRWWEQPGTPRIEVQSQFDAARGEFTLHLRQHGADPDRPLHVPLALAFYDDRGEAIHPLIEGDAAHRPGLVELRAHEHRLRLAGLASPPLPAFLQNLSAPVRLEFDYRDDELARLVQVETDPLSRWQAMQQLARRAILPGGGRESALAALLRAQTALLDDAGADAAFVAECLTLPDFWDLASELEQVEVDALWRAREAALDALCAQQHERLRDRYLQLTASARGGRSAASTGARRLRNLCLTRLARSERDGERALAQYHQATTLTDRLAALRCLLHAGLAPANEVLRDFAARHRGDALMIDRWLTVLVTVPRAATLDSVAAILHGPLWQPTNPNRVRAVLGSFARANVPAFHRADGAGYALLFDQIERLDAINPQVASRLLALLENWTRLDRLRRDVLATHLARLDARLASRDSRETLSRLRRGTPD